MELHCAQQPFLVLVCVVGCADVRSGGLRPQLDDWQPPFPQCLPTRASLVSVSQRWASLKYNVGFLETHQTKPCLLVSSGAEGFLVFVFGVRSIIHSFGKTTQF